MGEKIRWCNDCVCERETETDRERESVLKRESEREKRKQEKSEKLIEHWCSHLGASFPHYLCLCMVGGT